MSERDQRAKDMQHMISDFMKEHLANLGGSNKVDNNSFAFLEKGTLNLLIAYILSGEKSSTNGVTAEVADSKVLAELDEVIETNKAEFERIISYLKKHS